MPKKKVTKKKTTKKVAPLTREQRRHNALLKRNERYAKENT